MFVQFSFFAKPLSDCFPARKLFWTTLNLCEVWAGPGVCPRSQPLMLTQTKFYASPIHTFNSWEQQQIYIHTDSQTILFHIKIGSDIRKLIWMLMQLYWSTGARYFSSAWASDKSVTIKDMFLILLYPVYWVRVFRQRAVLFTLCFRKNWNIFKVTFK